MDKYDEFLRLHVKGTPLLLANAVDVGTAKALAFIGFQALATTSFGHAATLGRADGGVTRDEAVAHAAALQAATPLPVNADLEHCFADEPAGVAETIGLAVDAGIAGASVEDWNPAGSIYDHDLAVARVAAAAEAAHGGARRLVLTARAENHLRGVDDLDDTIRRLQAYGAVGADVLYAPALTDPADIRRVVEAVEQPVNVLAFPTAPPVAELAAIGVARVSVGGAFSRVMYGALATAAQELLETGTYGFWQTAAAASAFDGAFD